MADTQKLMIDPSIAPKPLVGGVTLPSLSPLAGVETKDQALLGQCEGRGLERSLAFKEADRLGSRSFEHNYLEEHAIAA
eukprot:1161215-Pelagomonas_calceolata.AAC.12